MLSVRNLKKVYKSKKAESVIALNNVSIEFPETGFVFLLGKSGSGKSTLLNSIGGLDKFDDGEIIIKGKSSKDFSQSDFDSYRNTFIGFIFQEYNILENFTVAKNLALALELQGKKADKAEVMRLLTQVEMQNYAHRKPNELSGGQKQRVAIARALIKNPEIIMADEPTGALDSNTGKQVMDTLKHLSKTKLVIVVSHDREFAELYGDRIIELRDGNIISDVTRKEVIAKETTSGIKIIDDNIIYLKKGQPISPTEVKNIADMITSKTKDSDAFISFDANANRKLKEGAKINDAGNKEKFLTTAKEDITVKQYNPNSLKLIRSRLGFRDSFKMGASSLKTKVGKLIFTILLSFFAFTVFGIIDALSCWNRADSVYQTLNYANQKNVAMQKEELIESDGYSYASSSVATDNDLAQMQAKFPDYVIKGVVGTGSYISKKSIEIVGSSNQLKSTNNPYKECGITGYVHLTKSELEKLGFELTGNLPVASNEIAISKHLMNNIISASEKFETPITSNTIIGQEIKVNYENTFKIVGIVDDKTDYSKYANMVEEELIKNQYTLSPIFDYSWTSVGYLNEEKYANIKENANSDSLYGFYGENDYFSVYRNSFLSTKDLQTTIDTAENQYQYFYNANTNAVLKIDNSNFEIIDGDYKYSFYHGTSYGEGYYIDENIRKESRTDYSSAYITLSELNAKFPGVADDGIPDGFIAHPYDAQIYFATNVYQFTGSVSKYVDSTTGKLKPLADDEIIIRANSYSNGFDDAVTAMENGNLYINFRKHWSSDSASLLKLKVVAMLSNDSYGYSNGIIVSENTAKTLRDCFGSYGFICSALNGSSSDRAFVAMCENYNGDNVKFTIQYAGTFTLDMFGEIIVTAKQVFFYIAIVFAVFAALLMMNFIATSISYKKREIGVLRALGARGSDVFGIFFNESMIIAVINFVLAAVATVIGCNVINTAIINQLGMEISFLNVGIRQILLILGISVGSAFIASLLPTTKISRKKPIDAINNR